MTKYETILKHLRRRSITTAEAVSLYKNYRLSGSIHALRNLGHRIAAKKVEGSRYVRYVLEKS